MILTDKIFACLMGAIGLFCFGAALCGYTHQLLFAVIGIGVAFALMADAAKEIDKRDKSLRN